MPEFQRIYLRDFRTGDSGLKTVACYCFFYNLDGTPLQIYRHTHFLMERKKVHLKPHQSDLVIVMVTSEWDPNNFYPLNGLESAIEVLSKNYL